MSKFLNRLKSLPKSKKIQIIIASVLTLSCVIAFPVMAWFSHKRQLKTASYINAPINLYITSTHESDNPAIDLGDIDVYDTNFKVGDVYYKNYVFCVRNINVEEYILQLAYTTNVPFKYEIFQAQYLGNKDGTATNNNGIRSFYIDATEITENDTYVIYEDDDKNKVYGYQKYGNNLLQAPLNLDNEDRTIANSSYIDKSYDSYSEVQQNVNPVYCQTVSITGSLTAGYSNFIYDAVTGERSDYYVLRVSWTQQQLDSNLIDNNKETDIIYITAGTKIQTSNNGE